MTSQWLELVENICRKTTADSIDIIVDQAGLDFSVIPALNTLSTQWHSLYTGLPEEIIINDAPLVARINLDDTQQKLWLHEICQEAAERAPILMLCSPWPFSRLARWLTQCINATHEGRAGILRFYDTRIFPSLFSHVLNEEQQKQLLRPALFWSWQDRDGKSQSITGDGSLSLNEKCGQIDLSDRQLEYLMCICDVKTFLSRRTFHDPQYSSAEALFQACFHGMLEATDQGLILDEARETWVTNKLSAQNS